MAFFDSKQLGKHMSKWKCIQRTSCWDDCTTWRLGECSGKLPQNWQRNKLRTDLLTRSQCAKSGVQIQGWAKIGCETTATSKQQSPINGIISWNSLGFVLLLIWKISPGYDCLTKGGTRKWQFKEEPSMARWVWLQRHDTDSLCNYWTPLIYMGRHVNYHLPEVYYCQPLMDIKYKKDSEWRLCTNSKESKKSLFLQFLKVTADAEKTAEIEVLC